MNCLVLAAIGADVSMPYEVSRHFLTNVPRPRGGLAFAVILAIKKKTA
jgi:hypothetical protein